ncbi:MAG: tetratricopeptide repeat protein [Gammaproteobacteria bacterium]|nr:tetratricopeptide repeat protein [Gammaproteobacteria bacterium]
MNAESSAAQERSPVEAATVTPAHVGPAALALLEQARLQAAAGDGERAAATLERALRIEADNPWLWHRLGVLRLQQGMWDQAIALALRSNGFARGNARLLGGNWRVIAEARAGQGDHAGAQAALRQARTYLGPSPASP